MSEFQEDAQLFSLLVKVYNILEHTVLLKLLMQFPVPF